MECARSTSIRKISFECLRCRWLVGRLRAHRLDVEADDLAVLAVAVADEHVDLVEGAAEVDRAEGLVLVVLQAVLVVQVDAPELLVEQA
jgi:hypothetical protein